MLKQSSEDRELQELVYAEEDAKKQLEADITATGRKLDSLIRERNTMLTSKNVVFAPAYEKQRCLSTIDADIEACQRGIARLNAYMVELFG
jgi:hypothetical protein